MNRWPTILLSLSILAAGAVRADDASRGSFPYRSGEPERVTLLFTGDVMQHGPQLEAARNPETGEYGYTDCFRYAAPLWKQADFVIVNLETTIGDSGFSGYPAFRSPEALVRDLTASGANVFATANNHIMDWGEKGVRRTLKAIEAQNVPSCGTYADTARYRKHHPLILEKRGIRIALLNYTYGTNNPYAPRSVVVNLLDTLRIKRDIDAARRLKADLIVAAVHWGTEYHTAPSAEQRAMASWLHARGVQAVVGSHPHVVQPIEAQRDETGALRRLTAYSLGNYISNQRFPNTDGGISLRLEVWRQSPGAVRFDAEYGKHWVWIDRNEAGKRYRVVPEYAVDSIPAGTPERTKAEAYFRACGEIAGNSVRQIPDPTFVPVQEIWLEEINPFRALGFRGSPIRKDIRWRNGAPYSSAGNSGSSAAPPASRD